MITQGSEEWFAQRLGHALHLAIHQCQRQRVAVADDIRDKDRVCVHVKVDDGLEFKFRVDVGLEFEFGVDVGFDVSDAQPDSR